MPADTMDKLGVTGGRLVAVLEATGAAAGMSLSATRLAARSGLVVGLVCHDSADYSS
jgi:hypothetical protein